MKLKQPAYRGHYDPPEHIASIHSSHKAFTRGQDVNQVRSIKHTLALLCAHWKDMLPEDKPRALRTLLYNRSLLHAKLARLTEQAPTTR